MKENRIENTPFQNGQAQGSPASQNTLNYVCRERRNKDRPRKR